MSKETQISGRDLKREQEKRPPAVRRRTHRAKSECMCTCQKRPRYVKRDLEKRPRKETCSREKKDFSRISTGL